mgnify:CR=1 FL=1
MRAVIQRVLMAKVEVRAKLVNEIKEGFLIYLGLGKNDTKETIDRFVNKVLKLRIFEDEQGKTNLDLFKINDAKILLISQFTLMANTNLGNRPSFTDAMEYNSANELYLYTLNKFNQICGFSYKNINEICSNPLEIKAQIRARNLLLNSDEFAQGFSPIIIIDEICAGRYIFEAKSDIFLDVREILVTF